MDTNTELFECSSCGRRYAAWSRVERCCLQPTVFAMSAEGVMSSIRDARCHKCGRFIPQTFETRSKIGKPVECPHHVVEHSFNKTTAIGTDEPILPPSRRRFDTLRRRGALNITIV